MIPGTDRGIGRIQKMQYTKHIQKQCIANDQQVA